VSDENNFLFRGSFAERGGNRRTDAIAAQHEEGSLRVVLGKEDKSFYKPFADITPAETVFQPEILTDLGAPEFVQKPTEEGSIWDDCDFEVAKILEQCQKQRIYQCRKKCEDCPHPEQVPFPTFPDAKFAATWYLCAGVILMLFLRLICGKSFFDFFTVKANADANTAFALFWTYWLWAAWRLVNDFDSARKVCRGKADKGKALALTALGVPFAVIFASCWTVGFEGPVAKSAAVLATLFVAGLLVFWPRLFSLEAKYASGKK